MLKIFIRNVFEGLCVSALVLIGLFLMVLAMAFFASLGQHHPVLAFVSGAVLLVAVVAAILTAIEVYA